MVATSAVRGAENGAEFCAQVLAATGWKVRILGGEEEANLIGRGLLCDPLLASLRDFYVFDLGGGSLECLAFRERAITHAVSLRLGCVRLTEKFVPDPSEPFDAATAAKIGSHVREVLAGANFSLAAAATAIGTGGTLTTARTVLAARLGQSLEETEPRVTVEQLREMLTRLGPLPLADRRKVPGLPAARADIFPAALATLVAVAEIGGFEAYQYSLYNLRWGLAAEALEVGGVRVWIERRLRGTAESRLDLAGPRASDSPRFAAALFFSALTIAAKSGGTGARRSRTLPVIGWFRTRCSAWSMTRSGGCASRGSGR